MDPATTIAIDVTHNGKLGRVDLIFGEWHDSQIEITFRDRLTAIRELSVQRTECRHNVQDVPALLDGLEDPKHSTITSAASWVRSPTPSRLAGRQSRTA
jgi:hypothetical protein